MILTTSELIASLRNEYRILIHLAGKIEPSMIDYRPTPKQRSTIELLRYLSMMGPLMIQYGLPSGTGFDREAWGAAAKAAGERDLAQTVAVLGAEGDACAALLDGVADEVFRTEMIGFDGSTTTRGSYMVNSVLGGLIAYRTQLFLYLKSCGREELNTSNLWRGADPPAAS
ncbi:MAG: hypothetical protein Q8L86_14860 [Vicinamibacterales bacterium]|nr:hypothetical protein [Vicinamibacterales bacterium]